MLNQCQGHGQQRLIYACEERRFSLVVWYNRWIIGVRLVWTSIQPGCPSLAPSTTESPINEHMSIRTWPQCNGKCCLLWCIACLCMFMYRITFYLGNGGPVCLLVLANSKKASASLGYHLWQKSNVAVWQICQDICSARDVLYAGILQWEYWNFRQHICDIFYHFTQMRGKSFFYKWSCFTVIYYKFSTKVKKFAYEKYAALIHKSTYTSPE